MRLLYSKSGCPDKRITLSEVDPFIGQVLKSRLMLEMLMQHIHDYIFILYCDSQIHVLGTI